ncbi:MAG: YggS family pyridoxal phosphate-dependent enzyme [Bacteroidales bacterium]|nr:YggS family pyridoxal phosphate-dependent enzyme [Bacteroidales bacterium]
MIETNLENLLAELPSDVKLVAVSKYHPIQDILTAYQAGQRRFAESRPQEFEAKAVQLPQDIEWHFIGHLQTNKLKMVLPFAYMVQSVDSERLLSAIDRWACGNGRKVRVLLELHVAAEESKQGFTEEEVLDILFRAESYRGIIFCGLMGMATNTDDMDTVAADFGRIRAYFDYLKDLFQELDEFRELSIGMSSDWKTALESGSTMVRIGTAIFGERVPVLRPLIQDSI